MSRLQRRITDYDRAVRALDVYRMRGDKTYINNFLYQQGKEDSLEDRKKLLKIIKRYQDINNLEEYHRKFLHIQTKLDGIIKFKWKKSQQIFWYDHVLPKILNNEPVRIYLLKARQLGYSTWIEGLQAALSFLHSDFRSVIVAHDKTTASKLHNMCKLYYKMLPTELKPARKKSNRFELELANPVEDGELGLESSSEVGTAQNLHLGAGSTLKFLHLSEFARYEEVNANAGEALVSLFQTMPKAPGTFAFIETTAYGEGIGKDYWDDSYNGFDKIFISWLAEDEYTLETPLKESKLEYKGRYGDEIEAREHILKELHKYNPKQDDEWIAHESLKRLNWRRDYINTQCEGSLELFQQEYPATAEEAFRLSGRCVFNTYVLHNQKKQAEKVKPVRYQYLPIPKGYGEFRLSDTGHLKIFSPPKPGKFYTMGLDAGAGLDDSDNSVAQIIDNDFNQVAVLTDLIEPGFFAKPVVCLAKLYNDAKIIPEINSMGGNIVDRIINDLRYTNVYIREKINSVDGSISNEWGFYTSSKTRPILIDNGRTLLNSGLVTIVDLETIEEMLSFIYKKVNNRIKMEAAQSKNDDRVMALLLALFGMETKEEIEERQKNMEPPKDSIEWFARQEEDKNNTYNTGNALGF